MVEERSNLDYGRDDETRTDVTDAPPTVEGDGFTMTDTDVERPTSSEPDNGEADPEA